MNFEISFDLLGSCLNYREKKNNPLFFIYFGHTHSYFSKLPPSSNLGGTSDCNSQIPKAKLFKNKNRIFHSYSEYNNLESVYWGITFSTTSSLTLLPPSIQSPCERWSGLSAHNHWDSLCIAAQAVSALRQVLSIPLGDMHSLHSPLNWNCLKADNLDKSWLTNHQVPFQLLLTILVIKSTLKWLV